VGEEEFTMRVPTGVWKAMIHLVAVLASSLLILVFTSVLPVGLGSVVLLGIIVTVGLLAGGMFERPAVHLKTRASAPTDAELQVLSTVPDLEPRRVLVCRRPAGTASPVLIRGRLTVVSAALVEALHRGWVSVQEVTALVVHARAYHHVIAPRRGEVAITLVETPGRMVVGVFRRVGRAFAWMPLGYLAWQLRGVMGVVCLVQSVAEGRTWPVGLGAIVIAMTYLMPAAGRAIEARATAAADAAVVRADLGGVLVEVLSRSGHRLPLQRRLRLHASSTSRPSTVARSAPEASTPRLHLVRS
jgi:hypothetical protein